MTNKMIKWPSIEQFRMTVKNVQHKSSYVGQDEEGNPVYDKTRKAPTLRFEGTTKLHGTNASVAASIDDIDNMWAQSRENIITPEKDNAGFAMFVYGRCGAFRDLLLNAKNTHESRGAGFDTIVVFGEWCGGNIQKTVALNELPKMFVIFGIALVSNDQKTYLTRQQVIDACNLCREHVLQAPKLETGIYSIFDLPVFSCEIDFDSPHESINALNAITEEVGNECPWSKQFGVSGIGEGVVWRCVDAGFEDSGYWFKVKDERHSKSKVKTLATVDVDRINSINELCERLAHKGRLSQGLDAVFGVGDGRDIDIKKTGEFMKWVMADIFKEELDVIAASGFNGKEISAPIFKIARDFLFKSL